MKALVFGITGQDGHYLSKLLLEKNIEVIGISRSDNRYIQGNVDNFEFVRELIKSHSPDYIFHLAANSTTKHDTLFENHSSIATGTLNILENVKNYCPKCKVFIAGSAVQFKNTGIPIDENAEFEASSPYSIARIHSVYAARYYRSKFNLFVYIGYLFNHDSKLRVERHINKKITDTIKRIKDGSDEKLEIGDINVKKEFGYAGDVVEAIWLLINQNKVFEAIIGTGEAYSIKDFVEYCFNKIGKNYQDYIIVKENFTAEYDTLVSNPSLIKSLGYKPKVSFYDLADIMMEN